jgi:hypothetical protein
LANADSTPSAAAILALTTTVESTADFIDVHTNAMASMSTMLANIVICAFTRTTMSIT